MQNQIPTHINYRDYGMVDIKRLGIDNLNMTTQSPDQCLL